MTRHNLSTLVIVIGILSVLSCSPDVPDGLPSVATGDSAAASEVTGGAVVSSSHSDSRSRADTIFRQRSLAQLLNDLHTLPGEFSEDGVRHFTGDGAVILAIALHGREAVPQLIDCLGDTTEVVSTFRGGRLMAGHMCAVALDAAATYEATDDSGDLTGSWNGYVGVSSTREQLREGQAAWRSVGDAYQLRDL